MAEPARWLGPHELLMTIGLCIPSTSQAQREFIASLDDAGLAGITVGDDNLIVGDGVLAREDWRRYALPTHRPTYLAVSAEAQLDGFSLVHLTQVLAVDANAILQEATERIRERGAALDSALAGRPDQRLMSWLADDEGYVSYRAVVTDGEIENRVPLAIALSGHRFLITRSNGKTILICPVRDVPPVREILRELSEAAGVSSEHHDVADLAGAIAEASSEFAVANASGDAWREFQGERVSLLARSRTESTQIVQSVLGPIASDEPKYVLLRETLFAFLDHDLRWKDTAVALGTHRQTLVYRLNQVEMLTGRSIRKTGDVSELWLARVAWDQLKVRSPERP